MACTLTIQSVTGQGQQNLPLTSVTVTGIATGCNAVTVLIHCTGQSSAEHQNVPVTATGQWQTTFTAQEIKIAGCLECENPDYPITVSAVCSDPVDPTQSCSDSKVLTEIPCGNCCPTVSVIVTEGNCDSQGRRNVTFQVTTTPDPGCPDIIVAQLDFGDGTMGIGFPVPPNNVWTETHAYVPGTYTAKVHIIVPVGCEDIPIKVGPLEECPCPTVTLAEPSIKGCVDSNSNATVTITATVSPAVAGCLLEWQFDDGYQVQTQIPNNANSFADTQSHEYSSAGSHSVSVTVTCGICSESATKGFAVPECSDGGDDHNCPWWDPRCWGSLCGALLAAAMAALITAGFLFIIAGCTVLTPAVLAGPAGAALNALVTSALFIAAVAALVLGLALLTLWYLVCSKMPGYHFCDTLHQVMTGIAWILFVQAMFALVLSAFGGVGCLIGLLFTLGSWGTVLAYLQLLSNAAGCPH